MSPPKKNIPTDQVSEIYIHWSNLSFPKVQDLYTLVKSIIDGTRILFRLPSSVIITVRVYYYRTGVTP